METDDELSDREIFELLNESISNLESIIVGMSMFVNDSISKGEYLMVEESINFMKAAIYHVARIYLEAGTVSDKYTQSLHYRLRAVDIDPDIEPVESINICVTYSLSYYGIGSDQDVRLTKMDIELTKTPERFRKYCEMLETAKTINKRNPQTIKMLDYIEQMKMNVTEFISGVKYQFSNYLSSASGLIDKIR